MVAFDTRARRHACCREIEQTLHQGSGIVGPQRDRCRPCGGFRNIAGDMHGLVQHASDIVIARGRSPSPLTSSANGAIARPCRAAPRDPDGRRYETDRCCSSSTVGLLALAGLVLALWRPRVVPSMEWPVTITFKPPRGTSARSIPKSFSAPAQTGRQLQMLEIAIGIERGRRHAQKAKRRTPRCRGCARYALVKMHIRVAHSPVFPVAFRN